MMNVKYCIKESFVVIGKEGSTHEGKGFIQKLWQDANSHFDEIKSLVKRNENGQFVGFWGAMSDLQRTFMPWNHFKEGLYLAGVECEDDAEAPVGWTKWIIPGYEFLYVQYEDENTFSQTMEYMQKKNIPLVGAAQDFTCPQTGENYIFFPIRMLESKGDQ